MRFAYLYRALAKAGAEVLLVPAAFSTVTGPPHWEVLVKARAIETGSFVGRRGADGHERGRRRQPWPFDDRLPFGELPPTAAPNRAS